MNQSNSVEQMKILHAIRGTPATLLSVLLFTGRSMTQAELIRFSGHSRKTVEKGLQVLTIYELIAEYSGRYALSIGTAFLQIFPNAQIGSIVASPDNTKSEETAWQGSPHRSAQQGSGSKSYPQVYPQQQRDNRENFPHDREKFSQDVGNFPTPPIQARARDLLLTNTTTTLSTNDRSSSSNGPDSGKISPYLPDNIRDLLATAGIGYSSPKMKQLCNQLTDLDYVTAHVLEARATNTPAGLLIRKLLDGDPAPPLRCDVCLALPNRCLCNAPIIR